MSSVFLLGIWSFSNPEEGIYVLQFKSLHVVCNLKADSRVFPQQRYSWPCGDDIEREFRP